MTFTLSTDIVGTGANFIYQFKTLLKSVGWTVSHSSDGTTYNSSGDQISSGSSGAGGMANSSAWFVITQPSIDGYQRQFCFQRGTTNLNWRIKYSFSAGFTGGSPGATQTPSATDESILIGAGTDASPTFAGLLGTDSTYRGTCWAGGVEDGYVAYMTYWTLGGTSPVMPFALETLANSSFSTADIDPYVVWCAGTSGTIDGTAVSSTSNGPKCWFRKGLSRESFDVVPALIYQSASVNWIGGTPLGSNSWNGKDDGLPMVFGRVASTANRSNYGLKGIAKHWTWIVVSRSVGSTLSVSSTKDKIVLGNFILPWNGTTPTL